MEIKTIGDIAVVNSETPLVADAQSALDLIASVGHECGVHKIALNKAAVSEDFFKLSTGIAGEVVQKFVNYGYRLAIVGDFSAYTSKPLRDYIYECNNGRHLCFVANEHEAADKLGE
ncbi:MAG: DUF4180 domain-containing protein [Clostridiales Family XIII bacterium]|nr:DUF4180 domain-containing protein [Clostridiales Family XIII bacterium]